MGPRNAAAQGTALAAEEPMMMKQMSRVLTSSPDDLPRTFRQELQVPKEPTVVEIRATPATESMEDRMVSQKQWQAACRDLHQVLHACQSVYLLFEHIRQNEALLRVAVEIVLCARARKMMWWRDTWWPDEEKRELFKEIIREKLRICLSQFKLSHDSREDEVARDDLDVQIAKLIERVNAHELTIAAKDAEIKVLHLDMEALAEKLADVTHMKEGMSKTINELRREVRSLQSSNEALLNAGTGDDNREAEKLRLAEERCQLMRNKILELEKSLQELMEARVPIDDLHQAQQRIADLEEALEKAQAANATPRLTPTRSSEVSLSSPTDKKAKKEPAWKGMRSSPSKEASLVADLQKQLSESRSAAEDFRRRLQLAEEDKRLQQEGVKPLRDLYHKAKDQLEAALRDIQRLEGTLTEKEQHIRETERNLEQAKAEVLKLEAAAAEAAEAASGAQEASNEALAASKVALEQAEARAQQAALESDTKLQDAKELVESLETELDALREQLSQEVEARVAAEEMLQKNVEEAQQGQEEQLSQAEAWQRQLEEAEITMLEQQERLIEAEKQLEAKEAALNQAKQSLKEAQRQLAEAEANFAEQQRGKESMAVKDLEAQLAQLAEESAAKQQQATAEQERLERAHAEAQRALEDSQKRLEVTEAQVQETLQENRRLLSDTEAQVRKATRIDAESSSEIQRLQEELSQARQRIKELEDELAKLQKSGEQLQSKVKSQAAMLADQQQEFDDLQDKFDRATKTLHVVKTQVDKLQVIAKKKGYGKEVEEVLAESGMIEYLNNPEWNIWERLYQDAKRRQEKARQIELVLRGQFEEVVDAVQSSQRRSGIASLPRAISHALSGRYLLASSLHLELDDDDNLEGFSHCPLCQSFLGPSPRTIKTRSRHASTDDQRSASMSPRLSEKTPQMEGSSSSVSEQGDSGYEQTSPPVACRRSSGGSGVLLPAFADQGGIGQQPLLASKRRFVAPGGSGRLSSGALLDLDKSRGPVTPFGPPDLSALHGGALTSTFPAHRLRRTRAESPGEDEAAAGQPSAMERDCGRVGSSLATSSSMAAVPPNGLGTGGSFGPGSVLHKQPPVEQPAAAAAGQTVTDSNSVLSLIAQHQARAGSRPGSSQHGRPRSSAKARFEALGSSFSSPGITRSADLSRDLTACGTSAATVSAVAAAAAASASEASRRGQEDPLSKSRSSNLPRSSSLPGLQEDRTGTPAAGSTRRARAPRKKQQQIVGRAGWFGYETDRGNKDRRKSKERGNSPQYEELEVAASEDPALMDVLREISA